MLPESSGATERARKKARVAIADAQEVDAEDPFPSLPLDIINQILSPQNLPDPMDLGRLRAVNRAMRDAITVTRRVLTRHRDGSLGDRMPKHAEASVFLRCSKT